MWDLLKDGVAGEARYVGGFLAGDFALHPLWLSESYGRAMTPLRSIKQRPGGGGKQYLSVCLPSCHTAGIITASNHTTHSHNRPRNNTNIIYSVETPKAPAINIFLITNCKPQ